MGRLVGEDDLLAEVAEDGVRVGVDDDPVRRRLGLSSPSLRPGGPHFASLTSPVVTAAIPRYPDAGAPSSPAIPSSDSGTTTTTRRAQSSPQASVTAGTARSASPAYVRRVFADRPTPSTRLRSPRTATIRPCSHSCSVPFFEGSSAATRHPLSSSRTRVRVRTAVTGAWS